MLSDAEFEALAKASRAVPLTDNTYLATDLVSTLLDTVVDYQQHTTTVRNAIAHFEANRWNDVRTLDDLEALFERFTDDQQGNTELALYLWGYRLWTRAAQLRALVGFVRSVGVVDLDDLRQWADASSFNDFRGRVKGLGPAVYQWLTMRLGVETVKPDVHVTRFVERAIGRRSSEQEAVDGLVAVASRLGVPANLLDWSIWEFERVTGGPERPSSPGDDRPGPTHSDDASRLSVTDLLELIIDDLVIKLADRYPAVQAVRTAPGSLVVEYGEGGKFAISVEELDDHP